MLPLLFLLVQAFALNFSFEPMAIEPLGVVAAPEPRLVGLSGNLIFECSPHCSLISNIGQRNSLPLITWSQGYYAYYVKGSGERGRVVKSRLLLNETVIWESPQLYFLNISLPLALDTKLYVLGRDSEGFVIYEINPVLGKIDTFSHISLNFTPKCFKAFNGRLLLWGEGRYALFSGFKEVSRGMSEICPKIYRGRIVTFNNSTVEVGNFSQRISPRSVDFIAGDFDGDSRIEVLSLENEPRELVMYDNGKRYVLHVFSLNPSRIFSAGDAVFVAGGGVWKYEGRIRVPVREEKKSRGFSLPHLSVKTSLLIPLFSILFLIFAVKLGEEFYGY